MSLMRTLTSFGVATAVSAMLSVSAPVIADDFGPPKKIDCKKAENKNKPACKPKAGVSTDDELHNAAYWLARDGQYAKALDILRLAANPDNPRILNATGFATRKLGHVDAALPYYQKALSIDPNYVLAREYLGEAYLAKGDLASAEGQLSEIAGRCGTACTAYTNLSREIAAYQAKAKSSG